MGENFYITPASKVLKSRGLAMFGLTEKVTKSQYFGVVQQIFAFCETSCIESVR